MNNESGKESKESEKSDIANNAKANIYADNGDKTQKISAGKHAANSAESNEKSDSASKAAINNASANNVAANDTAASNRKPAANDVSDAKLNANAKPRTKEHFAHTFKNPDINFAKKQAEKLAIVIVTYKRRELLQVLFDSIKQLTVAPWRIIVVDNENSDATRSAVMNFSDELNGKWGQADADATGSQQRVIYAPQAENLGGAGGFSAGVKTAYDLGAEWFWVMDDDVAVEPEAIEKLAPWMPQYEAIQGSRYDYDGGDFYWQYNFIVPLGIPNPIAPAQFGPRRYAKMNTMCFEGALFKRSIVEKIGLPDSRFFIYWDDTIYGYLASKVCKPIVIADKIMRRTRVINNWNIAGMRQLNSTSDMNRYYIMRNRGHMARYFMDNGDFHPMLFALGTAATAVKELIRIIAVDNKSFFSGISNLFFGWRDSREILHDPSWQPMQPMQPMKSSQSA